MSITKGPARPDLYHPDLEIPEQFKMTPLARQPEPEDGQDAEERSRRQELRDDLKARSISRSAQQAQRKAAPKIRRNRKAKKLKAEQQAQEREIVAELAAAVTIKN